MTDTEITASKPGPKPKLNIEDVKVALESNAGIVKQAAVSLGVSRSTLHNFLKENEAELAETRQQIRASAVDLAESQVMIALKKGDMRTVRWFLDRFAKERGYTTRVELTGKNGEPVQHEVATIDPAKLSDEALKELEQALIGQFQKEE